MGRRSSVITGLVVALIALPLGLQAGGAAREQAERAVARLERSMQGAPPADTRVERARARARRELERARLALEGGDERGASRHARLAASLLARTEK